MIVQDSDILQYDCPYSYVIASIRIARISYALKQLKTSRNYCDRVRYDCVEVRYDFVEERYDCVKELYDVFKCAMIACDVSKCAMIAYDDIELRYE